MDQNLKKQKIILGLDISTHCIGSTVASLDEEGNIKILEVSHLKLKKPRKISGVNALFLKSETFKDKLWEKYSKYYITNVIIEEPFISNNNAESVASLMRFNGMISQTVKDVLGIIPEYITSFDARKFGCPSLLSVRKFDKKGNLRSYKDVLESVNKDELVLFGSYPFDCSKKYILWNYLSEKFPEIQWDYNSKQELTDENFDASDSLMCVLGYVNKLKYKDNEPKVVDCSTEKKRIEYTVEFCGQHFKKMIDFE